MPPVMTPPVIPINYAAVILAAVASMVIGFVWYGPLFGKKWMALTGMHMDKMGAMSSGSMTKLYALAALGSLVMGFVLAHAIVFASAYLHVTGISAGLQAGFWNWLGFIAPVTLGSVLWERKPWALWVLNNAYYLVTLMVMGVILAMM